MNTKTNNALPDDVLTKGPKYLKGLSSLPEELRPIYKEMVEEYKFHALKHYGKAWVAYDVIAELVKSGWRCVPGSPATTTEPPEPVAAAVSPETSGKS